MAGACAGAGAGGPQRSTVYAYTATGGLHANESRVGRVVVYHVPAPNDVRRTIQLTVIRLPINSTR